MEHENQHGRFFAAKNVGLAAFFAIAGFYLYAEHRAHLYGILPYLPLLLCPPMHLFMHRGHGRHDH